jgi:hypothetical protein
VEVEVIIFADIEVITFVGYLYPTWCNTLKSLHGSGAVMATYGDGGVNIASVFSQPVSHDIQRRVSKKYEVVNLQFIEKWSFAIRVFIASGCPFCGRSMQRVTCHVPYHV